MNLGPSQQGYLIFLGLISAERIFELWLSKRNVQRAFQRGGKEVGQGHFRVMTLMHTAFLLACGVEVLALDRPFSWALGGPMLALSVLSQGLRYWAITTLGDRWNTRIIFVPGSQPVTGGPYRFLRHPNYLAVVVEMVCIPLVHGAYLTAVIFSVINAVVLFVRIRAEEEALGDKYQVAFATQRRLVPWRRG